MTVNVMYHLDDTIRCPGTWLNIILGVSVKVFLDDVNIWNGQSDCTSQGEWGRLKQHTAGLKRTKRLSKKDCACVLSLSPLHSPHPQSLTVFQLGHLGHWSPTFRLKLSLKCTPSALGALMPLDSDGIAELYHQLFLCLQITNYRSGAFSASIITSQSLTLIYTHTHPSY